MVLSIGLNVLRTHSSFGAALLIVGRHRHLALRPAITKAPIAVQSKLELIGEPQALHTMEQGLR